MSVVVDTRHGANGVKNFVRKFGRVVLANTDETLFCDSGNSFDGWLDAESDITVVSTSDEDKEGGGGATHVQFTGQGADGIEKTYKIPLNGITPVSLATYHSDVKFDIIYTAQCEGEDKDIITGPNHGNITIYKTGDATAEMAKILAKKGRTQMMIYRVPMDHWALVKKIDAYPVGGKDIVISAYVRYSKTSSWFLVGTIDFLNSNALIDYPLPDILTPGMDIAFTASTTQTSAVASMQMFLEKVPDPDYVG